MNINTKQKGKKNLIDNTYSNIKELEKQLKYLKETSDKLKKMF